MLLVSFGETDNWEEPHIEREAIPDVKILTVDPKEGTFLGDKYQLTWTHDEDNEKLTFVAKVQTTGWVGIGFSDTAGMEASDLFIGWFTPATEQQVPEGKVRICFI